MGTNCTFKVHLHDVTSGAHHQYDALLLLLTLMASPALSTSAMLRWVLASIAWPRKCSAGLFTPELLFPHSHIGVFERKLPCLAMGRNGKFCPFPQSNENAQICFKYSAWLFGSYFPFIGVINHLSLALSIHGLPTTLFSFLS